MCIGNPGIMTVMSTLSHSPTTGADITGSSVFDWRVSYILPEFSKPFSFRVRASSISVAYEIASRNSVLPSPDSIVSIERPIIPDVETCKRLVRDILCGRVPVD